MKRATLAVALTAAAIALVALPARAYLRSRGNNGLCLWWRTRTIPVVADVTTISPCVTGVPVGNGCGGADAIRALITSSIATWHSATLPGASTACTDVALQYAGDTTNIAVGYAGNGSDQNVILFRQGLCSADPRCRGLEPEACADQMGCWPANDDKTIAVTTTSYIASSGEIVDADMELHDQSAPGTGFAFTCAASGPVCGVATPTCVSTDLGSIVTHEAGHMLGLDHPPDKPEATMFATYMRGTTSIRTLDVDDVQGICTIYPRGQEVLTCVNGVPPAAAVVGNQSAVESVRSAVCETASNNNKSGGGGCSTATGGVLSMMGIALALGRGRRRRERSAG